MDIARPQRKRPTQERLEKGSGEGNVDFGLHVQMKEDDAAAQDRAGWSRVVCGLCSTESYKA